MANSSICATATTRYLSVVRAACSVGLASGLLFAMCWIATFVPLGQTTHLYIQLFTSAEVSSGLALAQGFFWALIMGVVAGALGAFIYNLLAPLDRG